MQLIWSCFIFHSLLTALLGKIAVEESATGAILSFPEISDGDLYNVTWEVEPAAFGFADYGGTLEAYLVLPKNKSYHLECGDGEPSDLNEYLTYLRSYEGFDLNWILVIDRGDCYFATKVYNAEELGASGVIMLDNKYEGFLIMWEPDDFEHDVTIPSVMLKEMYATTLMEHLGVRNWDPTNINNTVYPEPMEIGNNSFVITKALIEWGLPHDDDRVEWELWTSANDDRTMEFKHNFKSTALMLDEANYTMFTPHYYVLNGSHWKCIKKFPHRCGNQCTNQGRYCAVDPEGDTDYGISGMDVVQEDLRQLCIWNFTTEGDPSIHNESVWWDYSNLWNDNCFNNTNNEHTFNEQCSYRQMATLEDLGVTGLAAYVNNCINETGGYGYNDSSPNTFLDYEVRFRESESIHVLPTFRVNEFMIYGEVDCDVITEDGCSVLDSICSGFLEGTAPDICYATPAPTPLNCSHDLKDCEGKCYGTKEYDRCGQCLETSSKEWNDCVGCDNVTNSGYEYNHCDICANSNWANFTSLGEDCQGISHCDDGTYAIDRCDQCLRVTSHEWNSCVGCNNVTNSGYDYNPCGYCMDTTWANYSTYGSDCRGLGYCEPDDYAYDACGKCLWARDEDWDSCKGCDGVVNSNATWRCGLCVKPNTNEWDLACNTNEPDRTTIIVETKAGEIIEETDNSLASMTTIALIIGCVAVVIVCVACVVIFKLQKKQKEQNKAFENIMKTYSLMDEKPNGSGAAAAGGAAAAAASGGKGKRKFGKNKKERIPTSDELDDEEAPDDRIL